MSLRKPMPNGLSGVDPAARYTPPSSQFRPPAVVDPQVGVALPLSAVLQVGCDARSAEAAKTENVPAVTSVAANFSAMPPTTAPPPQQSIAARGSDATLDRLISNFEAVRTMETQNPKSIASRPMASVDPLAYRSKPRGGSRTKATPPVGDTGTRDWVPTDSLNESLVPPGTPGGELAKHGLADYQPPHEIEKRQEPRSPVGVDEAFDSKMESALSNIGTFDGHREAAEANLATGPPITGALQDDLRATQEVGPAAAAQNLVSEHSTHLMNANAHELDGWDPVAAKEAINQRVPGGGIGDELDKISNHVNSGVARVEEGIKKSGSPEEALAKAGKVTAVATVAEKTLLQEMAIKGREAGNLPVDTDNLIVNVFKAVAQLYWDPDHSTSFEDKEFQENLVAIFVGLAKSVVGMSTKDAADVVSLGCRQVKEAVNEAKTHHAPQKSVYQDVTRRAAQFMGSTARKMREFFTLGKYKDGKFGNPVHINSLSLIAGGGSTQTAKEHLTGAFEGMKNGLLQAHMHLQQAGDKFNHWHTTKGFKSMAKYSPEKARQWLAEHQKYLDDMGGNQ